MKFFKKLSGAGKIIVGGLASTGALLLTPEGAQILHAVMPMLPAKVIGVLFFVKALLAGMDLQKPEEKK